MAVAPTLEDELFRVENDGVDTALLDLGGLTFMDCSGLRVLLHATRRAKENGHGLAIMGIGSLPMRIIEVTGTERLLIDEANALRVFERFSHREAAEVIGDNVG